MKEAEYLEKKKFGKHLKKLSKDLQGKKVVIYGAGKLFESMLEGYDFSDMNIIAVSDRKYEKLTDTRYRTFDTVAPSKISSLNPDYVLVATLRVIEVMEYLRYILLKDTNIKVIPIIHKSFWEILKEVW